MSNRILDEIKTRIAEREHAALMCEADIATTPTHQQVDQLNTSDNNNIDVQVGDNRSMESRFHCLLLSSLNPIEDNGVAVLSPSVDITDEPISPLRFPSEAIKTTEDINLIFHKELIRLDTDISSLRGAIENQSERFERLERWIERLVENGDRRDTRSRNDVNRILQLYDQIPNKITIQYFLNTGKKIPPRVKIELRNKVRDSNGKPYYPAYQTLYGNCYDDFGISKFDKFSKYSINSDFGDDTKPIQNFISDVRSAFTDNKDMLGTFFYDVDTTEIFLHAYAVINKAEGWGKLFLYDGSDFVEDAFEFAASKAKDRSKSPDGIYTINQNNIAEMLGMNTAS